MKTSCKNIDIKNPETIQPFVKECIKRHMSRYDFKNLLLKNGLTESDYWEARTGKKYLLDPVVAILSEEAARRITERDLDLLPVRIEEKVDASTHKVRLIGRESPWQQIFDCIAVEATQEIWDRRIVPQQASSIKDRGGIYGTAVISKWIRADNRAAEYAKKHGLKYVRKCKYHVKIDIVQCYKSLRKDRFMHWFERDCGNEDLVWLWDELLSSHRVRLPSGEDYEGFMIGARPSQTAAQYILSFLYRFAMDLHTRRRGKTRKMVSHMLMFMDDMLLFSPSRKSLKSAVKQIAEYALAEFGLTVCEDWQIVKTDEAPTDMMGFLVHADGNITVRPRIFLRVRRLALRVMRKGAISFRQALRACSYKGYFLPRKNRWRNFKNGLRSRRAVERLRLGYLFRIAQRTISMHERRHHDYCIV